MTTDPATTWLDANVRRVAAPTTPPARLAELRSHLQDATLHAAHTAGRTHPTQADAETAWASLGGDPGISATFLHTRTPPRLLHRATRATIAFWALGALAGIAAATVAVRNTLAAGSPGIFLLAAAVAALAMALVAAGLLHLTRRHDLEANERLVWTAALILLPPVGAVAYFTLGAAGTRDLARRALNRDATDT